MKRRNEKYWIVNKLDAITAEILIYGDIYRYDGCVNASDFVKELKGLEKSCSKINVRINSNGGDVFEGIAIFNAIKNSPCDIDIYIDGMAASMGSVIAMAGRKVYMSRFARLMTHKPSGGAWGNADDLRRAADEIDDCEKILSDIYVSKTGMTSQKVSDDLLNGKDVYFNADQALKAGLIDGIYDGAKVEVPETMTDFKEIWSMYRAQLHIEDTEEVFTENSTTIILS